MWEDVFLAQFVIIFLNLLCGLSKTIENFSHVSPCYSGESKRNLLPQPAHCRAEAVELDQVYAENHLCLLK